MYSQRMAYRLSLDRLSIDCSSIDYLLQLDRVSIDRPIDRVSNKDHALTGLHIRCVRGRYRGESQGGFPRLQSLPS